MIAIIAVTVAILIGVGLYQIMTGQALRVAIGFLLFSNGVNLAVVSASGLPSRTSVPALIRDTIEFNSYVDPLPQAFVLTAIVISLGALGFILAMVRRIAHASPINSAKPRVGAEDSL